MLYKNDLSKKKKFIAGYGCYLLFYFLIILIITLVITIFFAKDFRYFIFPLVLILLLCGYSFLRAVKKYENISVETLEDKLFIKYGKRELEIPFTAIQDIIAYPSIIDRQQIMLSYEKWKAVAISSYLENFDELKNFLVTIKPISARKSVSRKIVDYSVLAFLLMGLLSAYINNYPLKFIFAVLGLAGAVFSLIRYAKSSIQKNRKAFGIIVYSFLSASLIFYIVVEGFSAKDTDFRKNSEGKTVLMNLEKVYKYDKNGNQIYYNNFYYKEKSKYNEKNQIIYSKNLKRKTDANYFYENDLLVEKRYSDGSFYKYEYDDKGNELHFISHTGYEEWYKYDENGNCIGFTNSENEEEVYKFNEQNLIIYEKDKYGDEYFYSYDDSGNCIKVSTEKYTEENTYNERNKIVATRYEYNDSRVTEVKYDYDEKDNVIYQLRVSYDKDGKENNSSEMYYVYDKYNNIIKESENGFSFEFSYAYDKHGRILRMYSYSGE